MKPVALFTCVAATLFVTSAIAQDSPPSYKGDPDVYKIIFEDANFRVISGIRKAGQTDKAHSHPSPGIVYNVNDCKNKLISPDGTSQIRDNKAGTSGATPITKSHQTQNMGTTDCVQVFVEKK